MHRQRTGGSHIAAAFVYGPNLGTQAQFILGQALGKERFAGTGFGGNQRIKIGIVFIEYPAPENLSPPGGEQHAVTVALAIRP